jgi:hypothetical protein
MTKWCLVLPPQGGARAVGEHIVDAFRTAHPERPCAVFDCAKWLGGFRTMLRVPDENMVADLVNQSMLTQCFDFVATHVLVCALSPISLFALNILRKNRITTVHWFYEDYRAAHYWRDVYTGYDHFFAIQRGEIEQACTEKSVAFHYLPTAVSPPALSTENTPDEMVADIGFIGIPSRYRIDILQRCAAAGLTLRIGGSGWDRYRGPLEQYIVAPRWVDARQSAQILLSCRIGINLSVDSPAADRISAHISPRVFDILALNRPLLTEETPLVHEALDSATFSTFCDAEECVNTAHGILNEYDRATQAASVNRMIIAGLHRYSDRLTTIFSLTE